MYLLLVGVHRILVSLRCYSHPFVWNVIYSFIAFVVIGTYNGVRTSKVYENILDSLVCRVLINFDHKAPTEISGQASTAGYK